MPYFFKQLNRTLLHGVHLARISVTVKKRNGIRPVERGPVNFKIVGKRTHFMTFIRMIEKDVVRKQGKGFIVQKDFSNPAFAPDDLKKRAVKFRRTFQCSAFQLLISGGTQIYGKTRHVFKAFMVCAGVDLVLVHPTNLLRLYLFCISFICTVPQKTEKATRFLSGGCLCDARIMIGG